MKWILTLLLFIGTAFAQTEIKDWIEGGKQLNPAIINGTAPECQRLPAQTPEPSSLILLGTGLVMAGKFLKKKS